MIELGKNIRTLRRKNNWTQKYAADRLNISVSAFSKLENGLTDINLSKLEQIAGIFQITVVDLLTLDQPFMQRSCKKLDLLNGKLLARQSQVTDLQKKVFELFEELQSSRSLA